MEPDRAIVRFVQWPTSSAVPLVMVTKLGRLGPWVALVDARLKSRPQTVSQLVNNEITRLQACGRFPWQMSSTALVAEDYIVRLLGEEMMRDLLAVRLQQGDAPA